MKTLSIPATIVPAKFEEIFDEWQNPRSNRLYFFYKTKERRFAGAFYLHEDYFVDELFAQFTDGMIYTLDYGGVAGYSFILQLRQATDTDLKDGKQLRYGYQYYVHPEPEVIEGPFVLNSITDTSLIAYYLKFAMLYVVSEKQDFTPYQNLQHTA